MKNTLAAKVRARNNLHNAIKLIAPQFLDALKPLVGQKIILATGELSMKAKTVIGPFTASTPNLQVYRYSSRYNLVYIFKTSEPDSEFSCVYQEQSVYFGKLSESGILEELFDFNPIQYPGDFSKEKVIEAREHIKNLENQLSNWKSKISYFGEYDT